MLNRSDPHAAPGLVLTEEECLVLDHAIKAGSDANPSENTLSAYLTGRKQWGVHVVALQFGSSPRYDEDEIFGPLTVLEL